MNFDFVGPLLTLVEAFDRTDIPYAIGGAIAYGFHAEPRGTSDIDINVFVPETEAGPVLDLLTSLGIEFDRETIEDEVTQTGQTRLKWHPMGLDLFFAVVPFLESCRDRVLRVPFEGRQIPILTAEDLVVCKVMFDRAKDWRDVRNIIAIQGEALDVQYISRWLFDMIGDDNSRVHRFETLLAEVTRQLRELDS